MQEGRYPQRTEEDIRFLETTVIGNYELVNMSATKLTKPSAKAAYDLKHSCLYSAWTITCKLKGFDANYFNNQFLILGFKLFLNTKWYSLGKSHVHNCSYSFCMSVCIYMHMCACARVCRQTCVCAQGKTKSCS